MHTSDFLVSCGYLKLHLISVMKYSKMSLSLAFLVLSVVTIRADKDTHQYPYVGFQNPNIAYKMYYRDAINVLNDLSSFKSLSVRFYSCVYSEYFYGGEENYGYGDESDYWYLGLPTQYKANIAYSLYGTLKDSKNSGCSKDTYINSFFTLGGVETLAYPLGIDTSYANSYCVNDGDSNDRDLRQGRHLSGSGSQDSNDNEAFSIATGCNSTGGFVLDQFEGNYCNTMNFNGTVDDLEEFNSAMQDVDCETIYDADTMDQRDDDGYYPPVYKILSASKACSLRMYPGICPDEHGLLTTYTNNLEMALYMARQGLEYEIDIDEDFEPIPFKLFFSSLFTLLGLGMLNYSYINYRHRVRMNDGVTPVLGYKLSLWRKRENVDIDRDESFDVPSEIDDVKNTIEMVGSHVVESSIIAGYGLKEVTESSISSAKKVVKTVSGRLRNSKSTNKDNAEYSIKEIKNSIYISSAKKLIRKISSRFENSRSESATKSVIT